MRIWKTVLAMGVLCLAMPHPAAAGAAGAYLTDAGASSDLPELRAEAVVAQYNAAPESAAQYDAVPYRAYKEAPAKRRGGRIIPPSTALQVALAASPGSQGLGVSLLKGPRLVYAVKLKTGNQIHRVLVDAETAQIVGQ